MLFLCYRLYRTQLLFRTVKSRPVLADNINGGNGTTERLSDMPSIGCRARSEQNKRAPKGARSRAQKSSLPAICKGATVLVVITTRTERLVSSPHASPARVCARPDQSSPLPPDPQLQFASISPSLGRRERKKDD